MTDLLGRRILIVEDEILIALMLQDVLETLGCVVAGIAVQQAEALHLIEANPGALDAVTLDINLGDETSHEIAALLNACGIPFIVTTGYEDALNLIGFENRPRLQKPYHESDVEQVFRALNWGKQAAPG